MLLRRQHCSGRVKNPGSFHSFSDDSCLQEAMGVEGKATSKGCVCASVPMTWIFSALLGGFGKSTCWELSVELPSHFKINSQKKKKPEKSQILGEKFSCPSTHKFLCQQELQAALSISCQLVSSLGKRSTVF